MRVALQLETDSCGDIACSLSVLYYYCCTASTTTVVCSTATTLLLYSYSYDTTEQSTIVLGCSTVLTVLSIFNTSTGIRFAARKDEGLRQQNLTLYVPEPLVSHSSLPSTPSATQGSPLMSHTTRASSSTTSGTRSSAVGGDGIVSSNPIFPVSAMNGNHRQLLPTSRSGAAPLPSVRTVSALSTAAAATAETDASLSSGDEGDEDDDAAWRAPPSSQTFVAHAKNGERFYNHDDVNGGAARIRVIVSDLDGTLLGPDREVSATTCEAVRRAR